MEKGYNPMGPPSEQASMVLPRHEIIGVHATSCCNTVETSSRLRSRQCGRATLAWCIFKVVELLQGHRSKGPMDAVQDH